MNIFSLLFVILNVCVSYSDEHGFLFCISLDIGSYSVESTNGDGLFTGVGWVSFVEDIDKNILEE